MYLQPCVVFWFVRSILSLRQQKPQRQFVVEGIALLGLRFFTVLPPNVVPLWSLGIDYICRRRRTNLLDQMLPGTYYERTSFSCVDVDSAGLQDKEIVGMNAASARIEGLAFSRHTRECGRAEFRSMMHDP